MPIFRVADKLVLFIHIPKAAGTSVETMLGMHPQCSSIHCLEIGPDNAFNAAAVCSPQHFHAEILARLFNLTRFDFIFTIIRDPLCRLLSEHTMRIQRNDIDNQPFDSWYSAVREKRLENPYMYDNHLRPAAEFIMDSCHVYDLSDGLSNIWRSVSSMIGIDSSEVEVQRIKPCGGTNASATSVSTETKRLIAIDYDCDFRLKRKFLAQKSPSSPWVIGANLF
jgi:hypothetical protein